MQHLNEDKLTNSEYLLSELEDLLNQTRSNRRKFNFQKTQFSSEQMWWFVKQLINREMDTFTKEAGSNEPEEQDKTHSIKEESEEEPEEEMENEEQEESIEAEEIEQENPQSEDEREYEEFMKKVDEEELEMMNRIEQGEQVKITRTNPEKTSQT